MKCPYCNSDEMSRLEPAQDCEFVLEQINTQTGKHLPQATIVKLFVCENCHGILPKLDLK